MRKIIFVIVVSILFFSCNFFKSVDQLLTQNVWELVMKQVIVDSKSVKYSKFSEPLLENLISLDFEENGIVNVVIDNVEHICFWELVDKENLIITISGDNDFVGSYKIGDNISSDFLFLSKQNENIYDNLEMFSFFPKDRN